MYLEIAISVFFVFGLPLYLGDFLVYRILPNKRTPPNKRPPFFFMITKYKELKEKSEVSKEFRAK